MNDISLFCSQLKWHWAMNAWGRCARSIKQNAQGLLYNCCLMCSDCWVHGQMSCHAVGRARICAVQPHTDCIKKIFIMSTICTIVTMSSHATVPQAVGFKCITCSSKFDTRLAADCHRRHPTSNGAACADVNWSPKQDACLYWEIIKASCLSTEVVQTYLLEGDRHYFFLLLLLKLIQNFQQENQYELMCPPLVAKKID